MCFFYLSIYHSIRNHCSDFSDNCKWRKSLVIYFMFLVNFFVRSYLLQENINKYGKYNFLYITLFE